MSHRDPKANSNRQAALQALQRRDYGRAIDLLQAHVQQSPTDVEAELELGLAELLSGERERFITRFEKLTPQLLAVPPTEGRMRRLWDQSQRIASDMARAAAILVLAGIPATAAGCAKNPPEPSEQPQPGSPAPVVTVTPTNQNTAIGDVEPGDDSPGPEPVATATATASASATATGVSTGTATSTKTRPYRPKNRYVAVRPRPVPSLTGTNAPKVK